MQNEQTPAAGPLTAESVKALTPWTSHNPRYGGNFKPVADDVWVQVKGNAAEPDGPARRAGDVYWGDQADCDNPVRWYREVLSPASSSSVVQGDGMVDYGDEIIDCDLAREVFESALTPPAEPVSRPAGEGFAYVPLKGGAYPKDFIDTLNGYITGGSGRCREALESMGVLFGPAAPDAGGGEREAVARIIDPAAFLFAPDELPKGSRAQHDAFDKADRILSAIRQGRR